MKISEYADQLLGSEGGDILSFSGENSIRIQQIVHSEDYSTPLIATMFWQAFLNSGAFEEYLGSAGLSARQNSYSIYYQNIDAWGRFEPLEGPNAFLISQHGGRGGWPRYDLIVFMDELRGRDPIVIDRVQVDPQRLSDGLNVFTRPIMSLDYRQLSPAFQENRRWLDQYYRFSRGAVVEAYESQRFGMMFVGKPELISTASNLGSPSPALEIRLDPSGQAVATGGVVARNRYGCSGVTTALHAFAPNGDLDWRAAEAAIAQRNGEVWVEGREGKVLTTDPVTDSCFIEVPTSSASAYRGRNGPLRGMVPRKHQSATFEGIASGKGQTFVTEWSPHLPFNIKGLQCVVMTKPDTAPGDSGSALVDPQDNVLGFACMRSAYNEVLEFSMWMWAESVFLAHDLF